MEDLLNKKFDSESEDEEYVPTAKELEDSSNTKKKSLNELKISKSK